MNFLGHKMSSRGIVQCMRLTRLQSSLATATTTTTTDNHHSEDVIKIPLRIERGPTDILSALEKTIKRDPTAPKYKYHDDPYLIPYSNVQKRSYALSQESGRKTAMWVRQTHANLFQHRVADPIIEEFLPRAIYDNKDDVSEEILNSVIANGHLADALNIYKLLDENTSIETKQALFELLCYSNNSEEPTDEQLFEEKWFRQSEKNITWKNCPDTEKLFTLLKENENKEVVDKAYNAMICGLAKYLKVERAVGLFEEALGNNIPLSATTFNSIIQTIPSSADGTNERKDLLMNYLEKMRSVDVQPNIGTLNSSLKVASSLHNLVEAKELARSVLAEFKELGIEPSLGSYNYILRIHFRKGAPPSSALREIIDRLEGKQFQIQDKTDIYFFVTAMNIAANVVQDSSLGDRIHKLLLTGDNYSFIGDGLKESIYYRYYFMLQIKSKTLDEFVENYYDLLVPHMYTPEPSVMDEIFNAIVANDPEVGQKLLPRFWTHIVQFNQLERKNLVSRALGLMKTHCRPAKDSPLNEMYSDAAWTVWNFVNSQKTQRMQKINWDGPILGDIAVLCVRAKKYERWAEIVSYLSSQQNSIVGTPDPAAINEIFEECIFQYHVSPALNLVNYCADIGFEDTDAMAFKVYRNLELAKHEESRLKSLVKPEVFKAITENKN